MIFKTKISPDLFKKFEKRTTDIDSALIHEYIFFSRIIIILILSGSDTSFYIRIDRVRGLKTQE